MDSNKTLHHQQTHLKNSIGNNCKATKKTASGINMLSTGFGNRSMLLLACLTSSCMMPAAVALGYNTSVAESSTTNPVQLRLDPFEVVVGPTDSNAHSSINLYDADTILGIVEDLITDSARAYFDAMDDVAFKYAMLGLVSIPNRHPEAKQTETVLRFANGGVAYFDGNSVSIPTKPEIQLLVDVSLDDDALLEAISREFRFITSATYKRLPAKPLQQSGTPPSLEENDSIATIQYLNEDEVNPDDNNDNQLLIIVVSACGAGLIFCALVALFVTKRQRERKAFWRQNTNKQGKRTIVDSGNDDAALEDFDATCSKKRRSSLHLRDSLRQQEQSDPELVDALSDSSSILGRLLNSASNAASAVLPINQDHDDIETAPTKVLSDPNGSHDTSSCSSDGDESDHRGDNMFEGNAVIKPNLIPVTNLDRFNQHSGIAVVDDDLAPLPPSRTPSIRRRERPTIISEKSSSLQSETPSSRSKGSQDGFLAKVWKGNLLQVSGFITSYSGCHEADGGIVKNHKEGSPETPSTAGDSEIRWQDLSSDHGSFDDLDANKTDDDFEQDNTWDPDDTSVNSGDCDENIFSPMPSSSSPSKSSKHGDEVQLLKAIQRRHYNLDKLRQTPPPRSPAKSQNPGRSTSTLITK